MFHFILIILKLILTLVVSIFVTLAVLVIFLTVYSALTKGKCKSKASLAGKVVLITGGNSGIGLETAKDLANRGAKVIIASRDVEKSAKCVEEIITATGNNKVEYKYLDLADLNSVKKFAEEFNNSYDRLDVLVNNSGIGGIKHKLSKDGIELVSQINYFGPFLLTNLLLDKIIASKPSRIVIVSSKAHEYADLDLNDLKCEKKLPWHLTYANTKLLNVLWAKALAKRVPKGVTVNALHPGVVKTEIFNKLGPKMRKIVLAFVGTCFKNAEEGAQTTIHCAVSEEVKNVTGKYFVDCQVYEESKNAQNNDLIDEVWEKSLLITSS